MATAAKVFRALIEHACNCPAANIQALRIDQCTISLSVPSLPPILRQVWGNLGAFLERLDDEWNSSLKVI